MVHNQIDLKLGLSWEEEKYILQTVKRIEEIIGEDTYGELVLKKAFSDKIVGKLMIGSRNYKAVDQNVVSVIEKLINKILIPPNNATVAVSGPVYAHA